MNKTYDVEHETNELGDKCATFRHYGSFAFELLHVAPCGYLIHDEKVLGKSFLDRDQLVAMLPYLQRFAETGKLFED